MRLTDISERPARLSEPAAAAPRKPLATSLLAATNAYQEAVRINAFLEIFGAEDAGTLAARKSALHMIALRLEHDSGFADLFEAALAVMEEFRQKAPHAIPQSAKLLRLHRVLTHLEAGK
jgi:hypothetical protein